MENCLSKFLKTFLDEEKYRKYIFHKVLPTGLKKYVSFISRCVTILRTCICTLEEKGLHTKAFLRSKISLNTGGVGGTREDPPTCKMGTFFICP